MVVGMKMAAVRSFDDRDRSPVSGTVRSRGAISPAVPQRNRPWSFPSQYGSSSVMDDMLRSDTLRRRARRTTEGNVVEDLIDFFRNTPPPPGNFVSTPDPLDEELKENKRFAFWPFRRKANVAGKEARTAPRRIRLPDSAVAGTTLDGYRHIAISIPIEYAHLELLTDRAAVPGAEHAKAGQVEDESKVPSFVKAGHGSRTEQDHRIAEPSASRTGGTAGGAGAPAAPSGLPPRQNTRRSGSTVAMMNDGPEKKRPLRHQPVIGRCAANSEDLQGSWACRAGDSHLLGKRPSSPESVSSTSSEPINSEAETVYIPSPSPGAGFPDSSRSNNSDEDTASYHTPALSPSSPGLPPEEAADVWGQSENWPALSDFLAPYGRGTFQTSSGAHGASFSHPVMYRDHQPHTLSDIPSETQTLQSIHLAPSPVTVVADIEPSSQTPSQHIGADTTDEASSTDTSSQPRTPVLAERRRPRRVRGISDLRVLAPSPDPSPCSSRTSYPSPVSHPTGDRIRRYDGRQRARQREFDLLLLDRLERLEQALERWTSALAPLLGHPSRGVAESARESEVMSDGREDERSSVSSGGGFDLSRARGLPVGGIGGRGDATGDDAIERTGEEEEEEYEEEDEEDDEEENINDTSWLCNMSNSSSASVPSSRGAPVASGRRGGALPAPDDFLIAGQRSGPSPAGGDWWTTFAGRRHQCPEWHLNSSWRDESQLPLGGSAVEDPGGWAGLETVMREIISGAIPPRDL